MIDINSLLQDKPRHKQFHAGQQIVLTGEIQIVLSGRVDRLKKESGTLRLHDSLGAGMSFGEKMGGPILTVTEVTRLSLVCRYRVFTPLSVSTSRVSLWTLRRS